MRAPADANRALQGGGNTDAVGQVIQKGDLGQPNTRKAQASQKVWKPGIRKVTYKEIIVQGKRLKHTTFDIPITINSRVEYWVDYFTGRGRPHFEKYLERAKYFIPYMQPILRQSGVPEDFVYLAMIESGFNNFARSHARAVGPWQFISATGKRYGLMVNWWVDERRDIRKSTIAAVEYLRELMEMFGGNFELAAASYNAGEGKIARAVQRFGTTDFWAISKHRFLRPETRDYVPKIIAAALISKNRTQFGFEPENKDPTPSNDEAVSTDGELVKLIQTDKPDDKVEVKRDQAGHADHAEPQSVGDLLTQLSQADLKGDSDDSDSGDSANASPDTSPDTSNDSGNDSSDNAAPAIVPATLMVPSDDASGGSNGQQANNAGSETTPLAQPVPTPHITKKGKVGGAELVEFDVKSPADLLKVARAAGLSYQTVKSLNPELLRWCTPPTVSTYRIWLPASVKDKFLATYNHDSFPRQVKFMTYKVRRGETLIHVARHFGIKVDPIADLNGVSPRMHLRRGARILLPMPNDRSRSIASLEVRDPPVHYRHRYRYRHYRHYRRRRHYRRHSRYRKISYRMRREAARAPQSTHRRGRDDG